MSLELERHLEELCEIHQLVLDLCGRLDRVRSSAKAIWTNQRLMWFTDHRASTHSVNIIVHLASVLARLQKTSQALTPHELYVLLAACYLHDIGMQDYRTDGGRGVEDFKDEDYMRIRRNHAQRSKELIIRRTLRRGRDDFRIDLDDDDYLVPIGLVSGRTWFLLLPAERSRSWGARHDSPGNEPLRGGLLASLLLMGDELDLPPEPGDFSSRIWPLSDLITAQYRSRLCHEGRGS